MILDRIVARTRQDLPAVKMACPPSEMEAMAQRSPSPRDFAAALAAPGVGVIAEVKRASPSKGLLCSDLDPVALARLYAQHGASAVSVLTDEPFFQGRLDDLRDIRQSLGAASPPLLRKDFIVDPYQIMEARAYGADAVLLIVALLDDDALRQLLALASGWGLAALVEAHHEDEVRRALDAGTRIIGLNNRDLRDFSVDLGATERLAALVPAGIITVSESGIRTPDDMRRLARCGVDAVLVGESLVTASNPAGQLAALVAAGREAAPHG